LLPFLSLFSVICRYSLPCHICSAPTIFNCNHHSELLCLISKQRCLTSLVKHVGLCLVWLSYTPMTQILNIVPLLCWFKDKEYSSTKVCVVAKYGEENCQFVVLSCYDLLSDL
jgi:hypothetical protein